MLNCCNCEFRSSYRRVLANKEDFYRRIEFGICPKCGCYKFMDFRLVKGTRKTKILSGESAIKSFEKIYFDFTNEKTSAKINHNFYYGDFKKTRRKDENGNPIYLQLRKNFNNDTEVLGEITTKIIKMR